MDVGNPSNFARILELYKNSHEAICKEISGYSYTDDMIREAINTLHKSTGYLLDPHGACGYQALKDSLQPEENGVFLETVENTIHENVKIPQTLQAFMNGEKKSVELPSTFIPFKRFLMEQ